MTPLKSLAHPEWPYAGTAHEWRGFAKKSICQHGNAQWTKFESDGYSGSRAYCPECQARYSYRFPIAQAAEMPKAWPMFVNRENVETSYQKLNFGPDLD